MNDKKQSNSTPRTRESRKRKDALAECGIIYAGYFQAIKKQIPKEIRKKILPLLSETHLETLGYYEKKVDEVAELV